LRFYLNNAAPATRNFDYVIHLFGFKAIIDGKGERGKERRFTVYVLRFT